MPLHLMKLAVGATSVTDLEAHIAARLAVCRAARLPAEHIHTTRMTPKRIDDLRDGSLFWVIRGQIAARQLLLYLRSFTDSDGIGRCQIVLEPIVVPVLPRPCRPFQGWRYLDEDRRPVDLGGTVGAMDMPEDMRFTLRELCLL